MRESLCLFAVQPEADVCHEKHAMGSAIPETLGIRKITPSTREKAPTGLGMIAP